MNGETVRELVAQLTGGPADDTVLRTLLDALPDAIVVVDDQGTVVFAGSAIERLSGHRPDELTGRPVEDLVPAARRDRHVHARETYAAAPSHRGMGAMEDITLAHRDGHEVAVDVSLSPVHADGRRFVVAAVRDASARQAVERALHRALEHERMAADQLREAAEIKNTFLRAVSHDLRTPLTVVQGLAETLEHRADELTPVQTVELATALSHNARRLSTLLTDLLDVDRLTRGTIRAERRRTDAVALVRAAVERSCTSSRRVHLDAPEQLWAHVDPAQLERIVENLLANADKHTPPGGAVSVLLSADDPEGSGTPGLWLVVEDEGPGVPAAQREAIFEPFARLDDDEQAPGSGIGLSLVGQFALLHGGRAWVEDAPGGGASFRVRLPGGVADAG